VRIYSGKSRVDQVKLPSGKRFYLYLIPYYLLPRLDEAINQFVTQLS